MPNWSDARWKNQIFRFPLFLTPYLLMVPCHEKVMALLSALSTGNKHVRDIYIYLFFNTLPQNAKTMFCHLQTLFD